MGGMGGISGSSIGSMFEGFGQAAGQFAAAAGATVSAHYFEHAAELTKLQTSIQETAARRQIYQTLGAGQADVAANGLLQSGSAADLMRSSAQQGALTTAIIQLQGNMQEQSYIAQAKAAKAQASGATVGGILQTAGAVASLFSDDRLKRNIQLIGRRDDGLGLYRFSYGFDKFDLIYEGVMASEVLERYPAAVSVDEDGWYKVNYDMIGETLRLAGSA